MWNFKRDIFRTENGGNGFLMDLCYGATSVDACECGEIIFAPFDTMVVRFIYNKPINGTDLDIMVYYDGTGTSQDMDAVGYGQSPNPLKTPTDSTPNDLAYLWWATDDVGITGGTCVEAVVIGVDNFVSLSGASLPTEIDAYLRVGWFATIGGGVDGGKVHVELVTYSGGVMSLSGTNIINTGGITVDTQSTDVHIPFSGGGQVTEAHSTLVGRVRYNKITKTALLIT